MQRQNLVKFLVGFLLFAAFASPSFAADNKIVGTWAVTFNGDDTTQAVMTYHQDGTFDSTSSSGNVTSAKGVWEKAGPRTFVERNKSFSLDANGNLAFVLDSTEVLELSNDGQSYTGEVVTQVSLPDGTPVATVSSSTAASRLN